MATTIDPLKPSTPARPCDDLARSFQIRPIWWNLYGGIGSSIAAITCAGTYGRNNAYLSSGAGIELGQDAKGGDDVIARSAAVAAIIVYLVAIDGAAAQSANQPPDTMAARVEACTPCHLSLIHI